MTQPKTSNNVNTNQTVRLSVQISLNGLSFLGLSNNGETTFFSAYEYATTTTPEDILEELKKEIQKHALDKLHEVSIVYATPYATVVPTSLFDEAKASEYLKFNTKILVNDFVAFDHLEHHQLTVVHVPFVNINNYIFEHFGDFQFFHCKGVLLNYILNKEKYSIEPKIYLHIIDGLFECIVIKNGKLALCNSYPYKTPEDLAYFTLFCFEQLKLDPNKAQTILLGSIEDKDEYFEILYTYIRNISFHTHDLPSIDDEAPHRHILHKILS